MHRFALIFALILLPLVSSAASVSGTDRYAWGDRVGWVNFSPANGSVQVTDSGMTGYAWSAISGWINLSPANGGVLNDGQGNLSGFAWGERTGWMDFDGVSISSSGVFSGSATGVMAGTISFSCAHCLVTTSWRPAVTGEVVPTTSSSGGQRSGTSRRNFISSLSSGLSQVFNRPAAPPAVSDILVPPSFASTSTSTHVSNFATSTSEVAAMPVPVASSSPLIVVTEVPAPASTSTISLEKPLSSRFHQAVTGFFSSIRKALFGLFR